MATKKRKKSYSSHTEMAIASAEIAAENAVYDAEHGHCDLALNSLLSAAMNIGAVPVGIGKKSRKSIDNPLGVLSALFKAEDALYAAEKVFLNKCVKK